MIHISDQELLARFAMKQLLLDAQADRIAQLEAIVENQRLRLEQLEPQAEPIPEGEADASPP